MAQVIEFHTLARFTPTVKCPPDEQRGKVIPFMSQREVSDELVCAAYEGLDSESSRWPERDEAPTRAALEWAQPLRLEEEPLLGGLFERHGDKLFGIVHTGSLAQLGHETEAEYLTSAGSFYCSCLVLDEWHERYPGASHRIGHGRIQWRKRTELASAIV